MYTPVRRGIYQDIVDIASKKIKQKKLTYKIDTASMKDVPEIVELIRNTYLPNDPVIKSYKFNEKTNEQLLEIVLSSLCEDVANGFTIVARNPTPKLSPQIYGVALCGINTPETNFAKGKKAIVDNPSLRHLLRLWQHVADKPCLFARFNVKEIFEIAFVTTHPLAQNQGIGTELIKEAVKIAKEKGLKLIRIDAASFFASLMCMKLGMKEVYKVYYNEYVDKRENLKLRTVEHPHKSFVTYVMELEPECDRSTELNANKKENVSNLSESINKIKQPANKKIPEILIIPESSTFSCKENENFSINSNNNTIETKNLTIQTSTPIISESSTVTVDKNSGQSNEYTPENPTPICSVHSKLPSELSISNICKNSEQSIEHTQNNTTQICCVHSKLPSSVISELSAPNISKNSEQSIEHTQNNTTQICSVHSKLASPVISELSTPNISKNSEQSTEHTQNNTTQICSVHSKLASPVISELSTPNISKNSEQSIEHTQNNTTQICSVHSKLASPVISELSTPNNSKNSEQSTEHTQNNTTQICSVHSKLASPVISELSTPNIGQNSEQSTEYTQDNTVPICSLHSKLPSPITSKLSSINIGKNPEQSHEYTQSNLKPMCISSKLSLPITSKLSTTNVEKNPEPSHEYIHHNLPPICIYSKLSSPNTSGLSTSNTPLLNTGVTDNRSFQEVNTIAPNSENLQKSNDYKQLSSNLTEKENYSAPLSNNSEISSKLYIFKHLAKSNDCLIHGKSVNSSDKENDSIPLVSTLETLSPSNTCKHSKQLVEEKNVEPATSIVADNYSSVVSPSKLSPTDISKHLVQHIEDKHSSISPIVAHNHSTAAINHSSSQSTNICIHSNQANQSEKYCERHHAPLVNFSGMDPTPNVPLVNFSGKESTSTYRDNSKQSSEHTCKMNVNVPLSPKHEGVNVVDDSIYNQNRKQSKKFESKLSSFKDLSSTQTTSTDAIKNLYIIGSGNKNQLSKTSKQIWLLEAEKSAPSIISIKNQIMKIEEKQATSIIERLPREIESFIANFLSVSEPTSSKHEAQNEFNKNILYLPSTNYSSKDSENVENLIDKFYSSNRNVIQKLIAIPQKTYDDGTSSVYRITTFNIRRNKEGHIEKVSLSPEHYSFMSELAEVADKNLNDTPGKHIILLEKIMRQKRIHNIKSHTRSIDPEDDQFKKQEVIKQGDSISHNKLFENKTLTNAEHSKDRHDLIYDTFAAKHIYDEYDTVKKYLASSSGDKTSDEKLKGIETASSDQKNEKSHEYTVKNSVISTDELTKDLSSKHTYNTSDTKHIESDPNVVNKYPINTKEKKNEDKKPEGIVEHLQSHWNNEALKENTIEDSKIFYQSKILQKLYDLSKPINNTDKEGPNSNNVGFSTLNRILANKKTEKDQTCYNKKDVASLEQSEIHSQHRSKEHSNQNEIINSLETGNQNTKTAVTGVQISKDKNEIHDSKDQSKNKVALNILEPPSKILEPPSTDSSQIKTGQSVQDLDKKIKNLNLEQLSYGENNIKETNQPKLNKMQNTSELVPKQDTKLATNLEKSKDKYDQCGCKSKDHSKENILESSAKKKLDFKITCPVHDKNSFDFQNQHKKNFESSEAQFNERNFSITQNIIEADSISNAKSSKNEQPSQNKTRQNIAGSTGKNNIYLATVDQSQSGSDRYKYKSNDQLEPSFTKDELSRRKTIDQNLGEYTKPKQSEIKQHQNDFISKNQTEDKIMSKTTSVVDQTSNQSKREAVQNILKVIDSHKIKVLSKLETFNLSDKPDWKPDHSKHNILNSSSCHKKNDVPNLEQYQVKYDQNNFKSKDQSNAQELIGPHKINLNLEQSKNQNVERNTQKDLKSDTLHSLKSTKVNETKPITILQKHTIKENQQNFKEHGGVKQNILERKNDHIVLTKDQAKHSSAQKFSELREENKITYSESSQHQHAHDSLTKDKSVHGNEQNVSESTKEHKVKPFVSSEPQVKYEHSLSTKDQSQSGATQNVMESTQIHKANLKQSPIKYSDSFTDSPLKHAITKNTSTETDKTKTVVKSKQSHIDFPAKKSQNLQLKHDAGQHVTESQIINKINHVVSSEQSHYKHGHDCNKKNNMHNLGSPNQTSGHVTNTESSQVKNVSQSKDTSNVKTTKENLQLTESKGDKAKGVLNLEKCQVKYNELDLKHMKEHFCKHNMKLEHTNKNSNINNKNIISSINVEKKSKNVSETKSEVVKPTTTNKKLDPETNKSLERNQSKVDDGRIWNSKATNSKMDGIDDALKLTNDITEWNERNSKNSSANNQSKGNLSTQDIKDSNKKDLLKTKSAIRNETNLETSKPIPSDKDKSHISEIATKKRLNSSRYEAKNIDNIDSNIKVTKETHLKVSISHSKDNVKMPNDHSKVKVKTNLDSGKESTSVDNKELQTDKSLNNVFQENDISLNKEIKKSKNSKPNASITLGTSIYATKPSSNVQQSKSTHGQEIDLNLLKQSSTKKGMKNCEINEQEIPENRPISENLMEVETKKAKLEKLLSKSAHDTFNSDESSSKSECLRDTPPLQSFVTHNKSTKHTHDKPQTLTEAAKTVFDSNSHKMKNVNSPNIKEVKSVLESSKPNVITSEKLKTKADKAVVTKPESLKHSDFIEVLSDVSVTPIKNRAKYSKKQNLKDYDTPKTEYNISLDKVYYHPKYTKGIDGYTKYTANLGWVKVQPSKNAIASMALRERKARIRDWYKFSSNNALKNAPNYKDSNRKTSRNYSQETDAENKFHVDEELNINLVKKNRRPSGNSDNFSKSRTNVFDNIKKKSTKFGRTRSETKTEKKDNIDQYENFEYTEMQPKVANLVEVIMNAIQDLNDLTMSQLKVPRSSKRVIKTRWIDAADTNDDLESSDDTTKLNLEDILSPKKESNIENILPRPSELIIRFAPETDKKRNSDNDED